MADTEIAIQSIRLDATCDTARAAATLVKVEISGILPNSNDINKLLMAAIRNEQTCLVAASDNHPVGTVFFDGHAGYVEHFAVDREYRRRGIGRALLKKCVDLTTTDYVKLHSTTAGEPFYNSLGFVKGIDDIWRLDIREQRPSLLSNNF